MVSTVNQAFNVDDHSVEPGEFIFGDAVLVAASDNTVVATVVIKHGRKTLYAIRIDPATRLQVFANPRFD